MVCFNRQEDKTTGGERRRAVCLGWVWNKTLQVQDECLHLPTHHRHCRAVCTCRGVMGGGKMGAWWRNVSKLSQHPYDELFYPDSMKRIGSTLQNASWGRSSRLSELSKTKINNKSNKKTAKHLFYMLFTWQLCKHVISDFIWTG